MTLRDEINALPERLRRYLRDLETKCDPSGDVQTIGSLTEQRDGLFTLTQELAIEVRELRARRDFLLNSNNRLIEEWRAAEAKALRAWEPIKTAPKDGSVIAIWLGGIPEPYATLASWDDGYSIHGLGGHWSDGLGQIGVEATLWALIPALPATPKKEK